jgi:hypothetical protein
MTGGKRSRDKGARGERECCDYFRRLGIEAHRVSSLETDPNSPVNYDVLAGGDWKVQVKNVARNCPALPKLMENAHIGYVKYTRGRMFIVIDADVLPELATKIAEGGE